MARIVRHERNSPYEVAEGTELPIYICACGLSKNKPFCDGSHKKTRDENPADVYLYDDTGRARVKNEYSAKASGGGSAYGRRSAAALLQRYDPAILLGLDLGTSVRRSRDLTEVRRPVSGFRLFPSHFASGYSASLRQSPPPRRCALLGVGIGDLVLPARSK